MKEKVIRLNEQDIENLVKKIIKEDRGITYDEYLDRLEQHLIEKHKLTPDQADNYISYFHDKGYIEECWREGDSNHECVNNLRIDGKIQWYNVRR